VGFLRFAGHAQPPAPRIGLGPGPPERPAPADRQGISSTPLQLKKGHTTTCSSLSSSKFADDYAAEGNSTWAFQQPGIPSAMAGIAITG